MSWVSGSFLVWLICVRTTQVRVRLDFQPRAFIGDDAGRDDDLHRAVDAFLKVEARANG